MWLALPIGILVVLAIVGGLVVGGVYLLILLPLALIALVGFLGVAIAKRAANVNAPSETGAGVSPLPHSGHSNTASTPATPNDLVDAQRQSQ